MPDDNDTRRPVHPDSMAVDLDGRPLPYSPAQVQQIVDDAMDTGDVIAIILRKGDSVMVNVLGPPSRQLLEELEQAVEGYRRVLEGQ